MFQPPVVTDNYRWVLTAKTTIFQMSNCLPTDEALEKEDRIDELKKKKKKKKSSPPVLHLLQAQQALPYHMPK